MFYARASSQIRWGLCARYPRWVATLIPMPRSSLGKGSVSLFESAHPSILSRSAVYQVAHAHMDDRRGVGDLLLWSSRLVGILSKDETGVQHLFPPRRMGKNWSGQQPEGCAVELMVTGAWQSVAVSPTSEAPDPGSWADSKSTHCLPPVNGSPLHSCLMTWSTAFTFLTWWLF